MTWPDIQSLLVREDWLRGQNLALQAGLVRLGEVRIG
jgi:hypothetical protein